MDLRPRQLGIGITFVAATLVAVRAAPAQQRLGELDSGRDQTTKAAGDQFGHACASLLDLDGDSIRDLVVSAWGADVGSSFLGQVYVFSGATLAELYHLDGAVDGGRFGACVADLGDLDGDGHGDFAVGADRTNVAGLAEAGRVYVFSGAGGTLLWQHDGAAAGDRLGTSVAAIGDVDGDGLTEYAIGATGAATSGGGVGAVQVHAGADGSLLSTLEGVTSSLQFGRAIAAAGDLDGDGTFDVAVSALDLAAMGGSDRGRVDVFSGSDQSLLASYVGQAPDDGDLGSAIDGGQDLDGDGVPELLVGDERNDFAGADAGRAVVYSGATGLPLYTWDGEKPGDRLGREIALVGDTNGDGTLDIVAGAGTRAARSHAWLRSGATGGLLYRFGTSFSHDVFGRVACDAGDLDGDGLADLLIGAEGDSQADFNAGRAYLFSGNDLYLQALPKTLDVGDTITISTHTREPSVDTALYVIDVSGTPVTVLIDTGKSDASGERIYVAPIPPGLTGLEITLQSIARDSAAGVVDSTPTTLTFL